MKDILYYPGCSLKDYAKGLEESALVVSEDLGIELNQMERWNCCGTVFSLAQDNLMKQLAPIRNLVRAREQGYDEVYTLCGMCYNTLKRADRFVEEDTDRLEKINAFMDREQDYDGSVEVKHYLGLLRDEVGWDQVSEPVKTPLDGLQIAPYYGCMLLRPKEIGLDDHHSPTILDDLISSLGGQVVEYPYSSECCGSYNTVNNEDMVHQKIKSIVSSANSNGADLIITGCPLCHFNLDTRQAEILKTDPTVHELPVLYFTQLMALAYGYIDSCRFQEHELDPRPVLAAEKIAVER